MISLTPFFQNPPILFFLLGVIASLLNVDLALPNPIPRFLALYLLLCIGFVGGVELHAAQLNCATLIPLIVAILAAFIVPIYTFFIMRRFFGVYDAAALAATYGSVSAVTFITGTNFLQTLNVVYSSSMIAALALMESPAIMVGIFLSQRYAQEKKSKDFSILQETLLNSSVFLILGSMLIGFISGETGMIALKPFVVDIFKGMLCLFLFDMGILATGKISEVHKKKMLMIASALGITLMSAFFALCIAYMLNFCPGNAFLFMILCASGSYIAVPAAMRLAIPEANPSVYIPMALGITFPFNILVGFPLYYYLISLLWS